MTDYMVRVYKENRILGMIEITKLNKKKIEGLVVYLSYSVSTLGLRASRESAMNTVMNVISSIIR